MILREKSKQSEKDRAARGIGEQTEASHRGDGSRGCPWNCLTHYCSSTAMRGDGRLRERKRGLGQALTVGEWKTGLFSNHQRNPSKAGALILYFQTPPCITARETRENANRFSWLTQLFVLDKKRITGCYWKTLHRCVRTLWLTTDGYVWVTALP